MSTKKKIKIIGCGITGVTIGRILAENGYSVTIYDKRNHIGGNMYDYYKDGILVHKYGPHIFHTSKENVYQFLTRFCELNSFKNVVEGYVCEKLVPIPFNFQSIDIIFEEKKDEIKNKLSQLYPNQETVTILELKQNDDPLIQNVAQTIYENLFLNYTTKMWGLKPNEIDESVTARIPVVLSYRNTYFKDKYEGLPKDGYTKMFEKMLDHKNIKVILNMDVINILKFEEKNLKIDEDDEIIVYSGPLDKLFNNKFDSLQYRSLHFQFETLSQTKFQNTAVVNYPDHETMTRITEYKNMTFQNIENKTVVSKEFPGEYDEKNSKWNEPYYPLATKEAKMQYNQYFEYAKEFENLYVCGRMGLYKYINMDQAIDDALNLTEKILKDLQK